MSAGDYIQLQRLKRTVNVTPLKSSSKRTEFLKASTMNCTYIINQDGYLESLTYFDLPATDLSNCLTGENQESSTSTEPLMYNTLLRSTPMYSKKRYNFYYDTSYNICCNDNVYEYMCTT